MRCYSRQQSVSTSPNASEDDAEMSTHEAYCGMCVVGYFLRSFVELNGPKRLDGDAKNLMSPDGIARILEVSIFPPLLMTNPSLFLRSRS